MSQPSCIHIWSPRFPVLPEEEKEDALVKDGKYGKALAEHLSTELRSRGYEIPEVSCENGSWWIEIDGAPFPLGLTVSSSPDFPPVHQFLIEVSQKPGLTWSWSELQFIDTRDHVTDLLACIRDILSSDPEVEILGYPDHNPF